MYENDIYRGSAAGSSVEIPRLSGKNWHEPTVPVVGLLEKWPVLPVNLSQAGADLPEIQLINHTAENIKRNQDRPDESGGAASLSKALELMKNYDLSQSKRLELAKPFFLEAIRAGDQLDGSKLEEEYDKELKNLAGKYHFHPGDRQVQLDCEKRAALAAEHLKECGRARIEYALVLNQVAVETKDLKLNHDAAEVLKVLQKNDHRYRADIYLNGAIKILSQNEVKYLDHDEVIQAGKEEVKARAQAHNDVIGLSITAVFVAVIAATGAPALRQHLETRAAAKDVRNRLPDELRANLPEKFHPEIQKALDAMLEARTPGNEIYSLIHDYKNGKIGSVQRINEFISGHRKYPPMEAKTIIPSNKSETILPSVAIHKTTRQDRSIAIERMEPGQSTAESKFDAGELNDILAKIEARLTDIDEQIAKAEKEGLPRREEPGESHRTIDELKEMRKELRNVNAELRSKSPAEREAYTKEIAEKYATSRGIIGKSGATVALLMVAAWILDASAKSATAASPKSRLLPGKR